MSLNMIPFVRNLKVLSRLQISNFNSIKSAYTCAFDNAKNFSLIHNSYPVINSKLLQIGENFCQHQQTRNTTLHNIFGPKPETYKKNCFFKVEYPKDGKYTIRKLKRIGLGGRDPDTGRLVFGKVGGGHKKHYRWVLFDRCPPDGKDPLVERVFHVQYDPNRTAKIALVGHDDKLRFIIATSTMKAGDLIKSTRELPRITVQPNEGDAHPVGALANGTTICCVELLPHGPCLKIAGGASATILRRQGDKVIIQATTRKEYALDPNCLAVVGQVSMRNKPMHPIGSPNRLRWLGKRPSSGLWQKKDGRYGRKLHKKEPPIVPEEKEEPWRMIRLTLTGMKGQDIIPSTRRVT